MDLEDLHEKIVSGSAVIIPVIIPLENIWTEMECHLATNSAISAHLKC